MRKRHVRVDGDVVIFDYTAKGGKRRTQSVVDTSVRDIVTELKGRSAGGPGWDDAAYSRILPPGRLRARS